MLKKIENAFNKTQNVVQKAKRCKSLRHSFVQIKVAESLAVNNIIIKDSKYLILPKSNLLFIYLICHGDSHSDSFDVNFYKSTFKEELKKLFKENEFEFVIEIDCMIKSYERLTPFSKELNESSKQDYVKRLKKS